MIKPQRSTQYALGLFKNFKDNSIEASVEAYYKTMDNQVYSTYNLYSRLNPYFVYLATNPDTKQPEAKQVSLLPIVPSVSYNIKF